MKNNQNIFSDLDKDIGINKSIGIVRALWNSDITTRLYNGCLDTLIDYGVQKENIRTLEVPGSFELAYGAKHLINNPSWEKGELNEYRTKYKNISDKTLDAIIMIGSIIKGETPHFDFIAQSITNAAIDLNISSEIPVIFCVSTDLDIHQALARSGGDHSNKGSESALTALKLLQNIQADYSEYKRNLN